MYICRRRYSPAHRYHHHHHHHHHPRRHHHHHHHHHHLHLHRQHHYHRSRLILFRVIFSADVLCDHVKETCVTYLRGCVCVYMRMRFVPVHVLRCKFSFVQACVYEIFYQCLCSCVCLAFPAVVFLDRENLRPSREPPSFFTSLPNTPASPCDTRRSKLTRRVLQVLSPVGIDTRSPALVRPLSTKLLSLCVSLFLLVCRSAARVELS